MTLADAFAEDADAKCKIEWTSGRAKFAVSTKGEKYLPPRNASQIVQSKDKLSQGIVQIVVVDALPGSPL